MKISVLLISLGAVFLFPARCLVPDWSPTNSVFASKSLTLGGKMLPNKDVSVHRKVQTPFYHNPCWFLGSIKSIFSTKITCRVKTLTIIAKTREPVSRRLKSRSILTPIIHDNLIDEMHKISYLVEKYKDL